MDHLSIDIETKSSIDIGKAGAYRYAQSADFEILLFAYKMGMYPVKVIDLAQGESLPRHVIDALRDPSVTKHAYNAAFEWYCLNRIGIDTTIDQWRCTMLHALYCGYPAGLEATGKALGLPQDKQKLTSGKALIRYFCVPCKPTAKNSGRGWNLPKHDLDKWDLFKTYNAGDVVAEAEIEKRLTAFPVPETEERLWQSDIRMNTYGVRVDTQLIDGALAVNDRSEVDLTQEAVSLTGLTNPNSLAQLSGWLEQQTGDSVPNLQKATVTDMLQKDCPPDVKRVLEIRQHLGKTSVSKYKALKATKGEGDRVRGLLQFYGANRTGRWAGRLVQVQNLPRNYSPTLDYARNLVRQKNYAGIKLLYGNVPDTLSQLIRTAFIPSSGNKFVVADFSAIEARVIAWLAGEQWVMDVFATHGRIYEATAAQMFHVPLEKIKKGNPEYELRQKGKVATLALGYQGGVNALIAMGALSMGLSEDELPDIVSRWRDANQNIVKLWHTIGDAALDAVTYAGSQTIHGIRFALEGDTASGLSFLTILLPSGRKLYYPGPFLAENQYGRPAIHYYGSNQTTKKWEAASTYGGKLTENIVQAIARDCLAETLTRVATAGYQTVMHIHDEVVLDAPLDTDVSRICDIMAEPISWAPGLILKGAGFESSYYKKD